MNTLTHTDANTHTLVFFRILTPSLSPLECVQTQMQEHRPRLPRREEATLAGRDVRRLPGRLRCTLDTLLAAPATRLPRGTGCGKGSHRG